MSGGTIRRNMADMLFERFSSSISYHHPKSCSRSIMPIITNLEGILICLQNNVKC